MYWAFIPPTLAQLSLRNGNLFRKGEAQTSRPKNHLRGMDAAGSEETLLHLTRVFVLWAKTFLVSTLVI